MNSPSKQPNIDLSCTDWQEIQKIIAKKIAGYEVWAFGSRTNGKAKPYSDLDLAIITHQPLSLEKYAKIKEAFDESNLPFRVDIVDLAATSATFRELIEQSKVTLQSL